MFRIRVGPAHTKDNLAVYFPEIVIPGHGDVGGSDLIDHTLKLALKVKNGKETRKIFLK